MRKSLAALLLSIFLLPHNAWALASEWQHNEAADVRLISAVSAVGTQSQISLGLEIKLAPKWHTYWRSPGDAGLPPQLDWKDSLTETGNLQKIDMLYPAPHRYTAFGLETIGYRDHVVLPLTAYVHSPGKALDLKAGLDLLVCSDLCVPKHYNLALTIPAGASKASPEAKLIDAAQKQVPVRADKAGFKIFSITRKLDTIDISVTSKDKLTAPDLFIENDKNIAFAAPVVTLGSDKKTATFSLRLAGSLPEGVLLSTLPISITVIDGNRAMEEQIAGAEPVAMPEPAKPAVAPLAAPEKHNSSFFVIILIALLGGFILNLMPCVLPVLSLKILSVISHGGGTNAAVRRSFLMSAAGIVASFLALALVTIALKSSGHAIGWGIQFQQPLFLALLIILLLAFASNLLGLYEIPLPRFLADRLDPAYHPKMAGDFATGAFATLLATPCSAPFLGTAIGFALGAGTGQILVIFLALGIGMAIPYLAIAAIPKFATKLPKPGMWMVYLRKILGLALLFTALWLGWVLFNEVKPAKSAAQIEQTEGERWSKFDESEIVQLVSQGRTVFVDVTADWCLTCKVNKKVALSKPEVRDRLFNAPNIVAMMADWTRPDPAITSFLQKYGRYGIPFNVVFGPTAPQGLVLPELLSPQAVLQALDQANKMP